MLSTLDHLMDENVHLTGPCLVALRPCRPFNVPLSRHKTAS